MRRGGCLDVAPSLCNGRYRLVAVLGTGGMATVYRAYDALLDVFRAVKVLDPELTSRRKTRERFLNEARTMAKLHHENVVAVYDMGVDGDRVYMLMELVDGGSLMERVDSHGPLPPRMALNVVASVLSALDASHAIGVVHRDVKPHNVLLTTEGVPKVTDFGIASVADADRDLTRTGAVMGTWAYMAPEQRKNAKIADPRSDVYGTGALLFAVTTGLEPLDLYVPDSHDDVLSGMPSALADLIRHSTRYKPDERPASAKAFEAMIRMAVQALPLDPPGLPPLALPPSEMPRYDRPATSDFDLSLKTEQNQSRTKASVTGRPSDTFALGEDAGDVVRIDGRGPQRVEPEAPPSAPTAPQATERSALPALPPLTPVEDALGGWIGGGTPVPEPRVAAPEPAAEAPFEDAVGWAQPAWMGNTPAPAAGRVAAGWAPASQESNSTPPTTVQRVEPMADEGVPDWLDKVLEAGPTGRAGSGWDASQFDDNTVDTSPLAVDLVADHIRTGLHEIRLVPKGLAVHPRGLGWIVPGRPRTTLASLVWDGDVYRTDLSGSRFTRSGATRLVKEAASSVQNHLVHPVGASSIRAGTLAALAVHIAAVGVWLGVVLPTVPADVLAGIDANTALVRAGLSIGAAGAVTLGALFASSVPLAWLGRMVSRTRVLFYDFGPERVEAWRVLDRTLSAVAAAPGQASWAGKGSKPKAVRWARALPSGVVSNLAPWRVRAGEANLTFLPDWLLVDQRRGLRAYRWRDVQVDTEGGGMALDMESAVAQKGGGATVRIRAKGLDVALQSTEGLIASLPERIAALGPQKRDGWN